MADTDLLAWDDVMKPLEDSPKWRAIRDAAMKSIERLDRVMSDEDEAIFGITSSDVNHTVYGAASWLWRRYGRQATPDEVLHLLREW